MRIAPAVVADIEWAVVSLTGLIAIVSLVSAQFSVLAAVIILLHSIPVYPIKRAELSAVATPVHAMQLVCSKYAACSRSLCVVVAVNRQVGVAETRQAP